MKIVIKAVTLNDKIGIAGKQMNLMVYAKCNW